MQNKLNEILELCIEKSVNNVFFTFEYCTGSKMVWINKYHSSKLEDKYLSGIGEHNIDKALKYMQNE